MKIKINAKNHKKPLEFITYGGFLLAIFLITRPFTGIINDGVLYALQALNVLNPEVFNHDVFFQYGSQDRYTIFSNIYALLIKNVGLNNATLLLELSGLLLWLVATFFLFKLIPLVPALIALFLVITLDNHYGSHNVIGYAESALTARLYAEFFSIFSLVLLLKKRYSLAIIAYIGAFLMHPVIALPALVIGLAMTLRFKNWLILILIGGLTSLILGTLHIQPFTGLVTKMDDIWWDYNTARSPFVFLHLWHWQAFSQMLFGLTTLVAAWWLIEESKIKQFAYAIFISTSLLILFSCIGGLWLRLPFIISLQLHRIMWLVMVVNPFFIVALLYKNYRNNSLKLMLAIGLAAGLLIDPNFQGLYSVAILLLYILISYYKPDYRPSHFIWFIQGIFCLQLILFSFFNLYMDIGEHSYINEKPIWQMILTHPIIVLMVFFSLYIANRQHFWFLQVSILAIISGLLFWSGLNWYDRSTEQFNTVRFKNATGSFYDSVPRQAAIEPIRQLIPPQANVYWVENPQRAWFWLKRANYISFDQAAGSIFSRDTTVELLRRTAQVTDISEMDSSHDWDFYPKVRDKLLTIPLLKELCQDSHLDYVITENYQADVPVVHFSDPLTSQSYGMYTCHPNHKQ